MTEKDDLYADDLFDNITDLRGTAYKIMGIDPNTSRGINLSDSQAILTFIRDNYITDDKFDEMLSILEIYIDVNEGEFELTADIVGDFVKAATYVKDSDFDDGEDLLILLLAALDLLE